MSIFKALLQGVQSGRDGGPPKPLPHPMGQENGQWHTHFHLPGSPWDGAEGFGWSAIPAPTGSCCPMGWDGFPLPLWWASQLPSCLGRDGGPPKQQHNYNCPAQVWTNYNCPSLGVDQSNTGNRMPTWSHGPWDHKSNYRYID